MDNDLLKLQSLIAKKQGVDTMVEAIKEFNIDDTEDKLYIALFTEKREVNIRRESTMSTPVGSMPCMVNFTEIEYDGGFEVEVTPATCMRICALLAKSLKSQNKEVISDLKV